MKPANPSQKQFFKEWKRLLFEEIQKFIGHRNITPEFFDELSCANQKVIEVLKNKFRQSEDVEYIANLLHKVEIKTYCDSLDTVDIVLPDVMCQGEGGALEGFFDFYAPHFYGGI